MNCPTTEKAKSDRIGWIDWIYWIDVDRWDNALVFNDESGYIYNQLKQYFTNVYSINVKNIHEFKKAFDSSRLKEIQFDLIFCTYLFHQFTTHKKNTKTISERLYCVLSEQGNLIFGYMHASNLLAYIIDKMLNNHNLTNYSEYSEMNKGRLTAKVYRHSLMKNRCFGPICSLFVYPSYEQPWTISDSGVFAHRVRDWKKRTRRNSILLWFMSSRCTSLLCKYWWPYRILIFGKQDEHYKHD